MSEQIYHGKELEYSDVLLVPGYSQLNSRNNADTSFKLGKFIHFLFSTSSKHYHVHKGQYILPLISDLIADEE